MRPVRVLVLSVCGAAGWLALSLLTAAPSAQAAEWGWLDDLTGTAADTVTNTIADTVTETSDKVTKELPPAITVITETVTPVIGTASTVLNSAVGTVTEVIDDVSALPPALLDPVIDVLPDPVTDILDPVTDIVDPADEPTGEPDSAAPRDTDESASNDGNGFTEHVRSAAQLTATLWPLATTRQPWNPIQHVMLSAGALFTTGSGSAGQPACDLPITERWLTLSSALTAVPPGGRAPSSPTYDTDCTPD